MEQNELIKPVWSDIKTLYFAEQGERQSLDEEEEQLPDSSIS